MKRERRSTIFGHLRNERLCGSNRKQSDSYCRNRNNGCEYGSNRGRIATLRGVNGECLWKILFAKLEGKAKKKANSRAFLIERKAHKAHVEHYVNDVDGVDVVDAACAVDVVCGVCVVDVVGVV